MSDSLPVRRVDATKLLGWVRPWALVAVLATCGPPLTDPSSINLTGRWTSPDHVGPIFNLELILDQKPDGSIVGTWSSDVSPPHPPCPPDISDRGVGTVDGNNTILGVQFSVKGAGDFQGQVLDSSYMRGSFESCGLIYMVNFALAGPVPAG